MLTDTDFERIQKELTNCNCTYAVEQRKRKGAAGMVHSVFLHQADTKELVLRDMERIARNNPEDRFHIEFDGIARFTVSMNSKVMMKSDYYEVEDCYQISGTEFQQRLMQAIANM